MKTKVNMQKVKWAASQVLKEEMSETRFTWQNLFIAAGLPIVTTMVVLFVMKQNLSNEGEVLGMFIPSVFYVVTVVLTNKRYSWMKGIHQHP